MRSPHDITRLVAALNRAVVDLGVIAAGAAALSGTTDDLRQIVSSLADEAADAERRWSEAGPSLRDYGDGDPGGPDG